MRIRIVPVAMIFIQPRELADKRLRLAVKAVVVILRVETLIVDVLLLLQLRQLVG